MFQCSVVFWYTAKTSQNTGMEQAAAAKAGKSTKKVDGQKTMQHWNIGTF
jgi:hypothetical protein